MTIQEARQYTNQYIDIVILGEYERHHTGMIVKFFNNYIIFNVNCESNYIPINYDQISRITKLPEPPEYQI